VDAPALLSRLVGRRLASAEYLAVALAVLAAAAAALVSLRRWRDERADHLAMAVICLGILLSVHHQTYDLVLLIAPVIALAQSHLPASFLTPGRRAGLIILFLVLGLNYVTTQSVLQRLEHHGGLWLLMASLNGAFLLVIFLVYVTPLLRRAGSAVAVPSPTTSAS
jgi:hypothetical protein